jgi:SAM-dependent methyltransferase
MSSPWPKTFPPLTAEQTRISNDFIQHWHEVLPQRFGIVDRFNHRYPVEHASADFIHTLEIGAGLAEHVLYEKLSPSQESNYVAVELRQNMVDAIRSRFPRIRAMVGDCQARLDFPDGYFDRILAIHVLEHLPDLPRCVAEMHRLCDPSKGVFSVVIPCEGSPPYSLARRISAQRIFESRYKQSYRWYIEREHINLPAEILAELDRHFRVTHRTFFPFPFLPFVACNLVIGLTLKPR